MLLLFFFKQKTAYEMRISDWSSVVCSSDLGSPRIPQRPRPRRDSRATPRHLFFTPRFCARLRRLAIHPGGVAMADTLTLTAEDGHKLAAYMAQPEGRPKGGVVVIQEIFGVNAQDRKSTRLNSSH